MSITFARLDENGRQFLPVLLSKLNPRTDRVENEQLVIRLGKNVEAKALFI